jgi:hypothetical protein
VSQLAEQEVAAYRQLEEEKAEDVLDELLDICRSQKVWNQLRAPVFSFATTIIAVYFQLSMPLLLWASDFGFLAQLLFYAPSLDC